MKIESHKEEDEVEAKQFMEDWARSLGCWPFPAPGGPVPWTKQQEHEYKKQQREQLPEAPI